MSLPDPPSVALSERKLGPVEVLKRGRANALSIIPAQALTEPIWSGRTVWTWHHVAGPAEMRHVLVENADNYPRAPLAHRVLAPALGRSMIMATGADFNWQKRLLMPFFHKSRSADQLEIFLECAADQATELPDDGPFEMDVLDYMVRLAMTVILRAISSADGDPSSERLRIAFTEYLDDVVRVSPIDYLRLPSWIASALRPASARTLQIVREEIGAIIETRKAEGARGRSDLLQALLDSIDPATGAPMPSSQIRDNLLLMVFAGHETSANTLAWAIFLLARDPDLQDRVRAEAGPVPDGDDAKLPDDTPVLDAVLQETLRLYPAAPMLIREVAQDDQISGCPVKKGAFLFVPFYALHRNERLWEDPNSFKPERFLEGAEKQQPFQYLPFSAGPRSCIGASFAQLEMRAILTDFLRRFRFHPAPNRPDPRPEALLTLKPEGGVWITAERC